jgi:hypothetical protein
MLVGYYQRTFLALFECAEEEVEVLECDLRGIVWLDEAFENRVCRHHPSKRGPEEWGKIVFYKIINISKKTPIPVSVRARSSPLHTFLELIYDISKYVCMSSLSKAIVQVLPPASIYIFLEASREPLRSILSSSYSVAS